MPALACTANHLVALVDAGSLDSDGHNAANKGNAKGNPKAAIPVREGCNGKGRWLLDLGANGKLSFPPVSLHVAFCGLHHASRRPIRASDEPRGRALNCAQLEVSTGTCCAARRHGQDAGPPADFVAFRGRE